MKYSKIRLTTPSGVALSLSNDFSNVYEVEDAIEDAKDAKDLERKLNNKSEISSYLKSVTLEREGENSVRYKCIANMCDNVHYLTICF